jgi:hypothetical protein
LRRGGGRGDSDGEAVTGEFELWGGKWVSISFLCRETGKWVLFPFVTKRQVSGFYFFSLQRDRQVDFFYFLLLQRYRAREMARTERDTKRASF